MLDRVHDDMNSALKAGDKKTAEALRLLYSALKNAQIDSGGTLDDDKAVKVIKKEMKKRVEARDLYAQNAREEQAAQEEFERTLYGQYAPADLTAPQIDEIIMQVVNGVTDMSFSAIMPLVMKQTNGNADGRLVAERVKIYLEKTK